MAQIEISKYKTLQYNIGDLNKELKNMASNLNVSLETLKKVFSRNDIGKVINISKERTIDVMITRLIQKIESNPKNPKYLQTIRGSVYVLWIK